MTKIALSAGSEAIVNEWQLSQKDYFIRGDNGNSGVEKKIFSWLRKISLKKNLRKINSQ